MKTSEVHFRFPVLGFTPDLESWAFPSLDVLTKCGPRTIPENLQQDMELVDADGRRWRVVSVQRAGPGEPPFSLSTWVKRLFYAPQSRIEHELQAMPPLSLDEIKARLKTSIAAFPEDRGQYDDGDDILPGLFADVDAAPSVAALQDLLGLDSFESY